MDNGKAALCFSIPDEMTRKTLLNSILFLVSVAVGMLLCEVSARLLLFIRTPNGMVFDKEIVYTYKPYTTTESFKLNNVGAVGDDIRIDKEKNEIRIFLLGESTSFNETYVDTVRKLVSARYGNYSVKVVSWGKPRYTSYTNKVNLEINILQYKPDIIVLYMGINDNLYNTFPWLTGLPDIGYFNWHAGNESIAAKLVKYFIIDKEIKSRPDFSANELRSKDIFRSNVTAIIEKARQNNIGVVLSTFAISYPSDDPLMVKLIKAREREMEHSWGKTNSTAIGVLEHNKILRQLSGQYGLPLALNYELIPKNSQYFIDMCHFTGKGIELLGANMADMILKSGYINLTATD